MVRFHCWVLGGDRLRFRRKVVSGSGSWPTMPVLDRTINITGDYSPVAEAEAILAEANADAALALA
jgi:acyl dehydratase